MKIVTLSVREWILKIGGIRTCSKKNYQGRVLFFYTLQKFGDTQNTHTHTHIYNYSNLPKTFQYS